MFPGNTVPKIIKIQTSERGRFVTQCILMSDVKLGAVVAGC